jgi:predicted transposase YbfD/YdcC
MIAADNMPSLKEVKQTRIPSLYEALERIPDPRETQGLRHPLTSMLALTCVALLCGYQSPYAISEWVHNYGQQYLRKFKFTRSEPPGQATWYRVLGAIDRHALEVQLAAWAHQVVMAIGQVLPLQGVAIDGKTLRGSKKQGAQDTHLLSAVAHILGITLGQLAVADKTNEIGAITDLLSMIVLRGCVVTTDALLTQVKIANQILDAGGEFVFIVKKNQKTLYEDIQLLFESPPPLTRGQAWPQATTVNSGHGRVEVRSLTASTALNEYLTWPGVQQVFALKRTVTRNDQTTTEVVYGLTSLSPKMASADQLLTFTRHHWHIENKSHWVRDVTFNEDHSQVRRVNLPHVMAALRNAVIGLLRAFGIANIARALRHFAAQPDKALALVGLPGE